MNTKMCTICNIEKISTIFTKNIQNAETVIVQRYYENKDIISNQQKNIMKRLEKKCYYRKRTIDVYNLEIQLYLMLN